MTSAEINAYLSYLISLTEEEKRRELEQVEKCLEDKSQPLIDMVTLAWQAAQLREFLRPKTGSVSSQSEERENE